MGWKHVPFWSKEMLERESFHFYTISRLSVPVLIPKKEEEQWDREQARKRLWDFLVFFFLRTKSHLQINTPLNDHNNVYSIWSAYK